MNDYFEQQQYDELIKLRVENHELNQIFELRKQADEKALIVWQSQHPEQLFTIPNHTDLCLSLMELLRAAYIEIANERERRVLAQEAILKYVTINQM